MSTHQEAIDLVRRYAAIGATRDLDALDALFTDDFVNHHPAGPSRGLDALKQFVGGVLSQWPELAISVDTAFANTMFADGPRVGALVTLHGHNPERNRRLELRELWIFRVRDGKLAERWYVVDQEAVPTR